jgi:hypothetical protein
MAIENYVWKAVQAAATKSNYPRGKYILIDSPDYTLTREEQVSFTKFSIAGRYTVLVSTELLERTDYGTFLAAAQLDYRTTVLELLNHKYFLMSAAAEREIYGLPTPAEITLDAINGGEKWRQLSAALTAMAAEKATRTKEVANIVAITDLRAYAESVEISVASAFPDSITRLA